LYDVLVVYIAFLFANLIRHNFEFLSVNPGILTYQSLFVVSVYLASFFVFHSFSGIIRHTSLVDALRIFKATGAAFILLLVMIATLGTYKLAPRPLPGLAVTIIHFLMVTFVLIGSRFIIRTIYSDIVRKGRKRHVKVLIYGAGSAGMLTRIALMQDTHYYYEIVAFIDDNNSKVNKMLEGVPVVSAHRALSQQYVDKHEISQLIIAIQHIDINQRKHIIETGLELKILVKVVPGIDRWINGQLSATQLREVRIEELLEREPIRLDNENVAAYIHNKVVMVTGAAGSIGSEIVRQVLQYKPARVVLIDQAESPLYDLQFEINSTPAFSDFAGSAVYLIASVKDRMRMEYVFQTYKPQIIFHAAAYKHVPLMEDHPYEAILVNVFGTKVIADMAVKYHAKKFVMVSTDKAVNPTNVMGATKRIAEIYTQSLSNGTTQFITTRFGNVLGSNGSVIPIFKKQIERGGPVTLTHKDITRYFMTIPEACNLVLEAGIINTQTRSNGKAIEWFYSGKHASQNLVLHSTSFCQRHHGQWVCNFAFQEVGNTVVFSAWIF
jgi:FlaA1/EpsC-like NDP-sugar epimerase